MYLTTIAIALPLDNVDSSSLQKNSANGKPRKITQGLETQPERSSISRKLVILFSGLPGNASRLCSFATVSMNILLGSLVTDFVLRPPLLYPVEDLRFSRVGFVGSDVANILVREPDASQLPLSLSYRQASIESWTEVGKLYKLSNETDYTHPFTISGLLSSTTYFYSFSNNVSGDFTTAPVSSDSLTFLTSSCIKARFPFNVVLNPLEIRGFHYLPSVLSRFPSPNKFMLFLGDFIYVDVPWRMSSSLSHYRSEYRRVYASPSWSLSASLRALPWIHTWDDHEIANDWSSGSESPFPAAVDPFRHYHASVNPPIPKSASSDNSTFFSWNNGPASFFLLDTRTYRTDPEPNVDATILGPTQLTALLEFIHAPVEPEVKWKIVASSVPFTKNWRVGTKDTWGGFLRERQRVLTAMHTAEADLGVRVIILSGDRHEFGAIRFPSPRDNASSSHQGVHEFSVGPLSMFYLPFKSFKQVDDEDIIIHYQPIGNSKVGIIDIGKEQNSEGATSSVLEYLLYVDGKESWRYTLRAPL